MLAKDVMRTPAITIREGATVAELTELLQTEHVSGVPVVDGDGTVIGVVTEKDVLYGSMGVSGGVGPGSTPLEAPSPLQIRVEEIMTAPAVCADADTSLAEVCRMMWRFHIHRVPIVSEGKPLGIIAAMDLVRLVAEGDLAI